MRTTTRLLALTVTLGIGLAASGPASAEVGFEFQPDAQSFSPVGADALRGGAHPDVEVTFGVKPDPDVGGAPGRPAAAIKTVDVDLPAGLVGNPTGLSTCGIDAVLANELPTGAGLCPRDAAVGWAQFDFAYPAGQTFTPQRRRIWRVPAQPGEAAVFATSIATVPVRMVASVSPSGGYRLRVLADKLPQSAYVRNFKARFWGVPADHQGIGDDCDGNDYPVIGVLRCADGSAPGAEGPIPAVRFGGPLAGAPRKALMSNPSQCSGQPLTTDLALTPWGPRAPISTTMLAGTLTGCDQQPFDPAIAVTPAAPWASAPVGYTVDVTVPQTDAAGSLATAHLEDATVTLPQGVAISAPSVDGLQACTDAQLGLSSDGPAACADASKIGTVRVETPLLDEPLTGSIYLGDQQSQDPESGEMYRIFLVAKGPGSLVKLRGAVRADKATGQLTATFLDNPQLPFSRMSLTFKDGDRAPLANPATCGGFATHYRFAAWSGAVKEGDSAPFTVGRDCGNADQFAPALSAGLANPVAAQSSAFVFDLVRPDGQQNVAGVEVSLPEGLLGRLRGIPICADAAAATGACDGRSRVGHTTVAVGSGARPLYVPQAGKAPTAVYLGAPYKGAPYSLVIKVPAQAGPYDLGTVVVRAALFIDPNDAHVRVVADPLPQVVGGAPLRYRKINVAIDRPGFMFAPTSCREKAIDASVGSDGGAKVGLASRFWATGCSKLAFQPRLAMRLLGGKGRTRTGGHPALKAVLTQKAGQANIDRARVALPKSIVLDPNNSVDPKKVCGYDESLKADCPASSVIGSATAYTPVLDKPLSGQVHLVQGIRFGPTGNRIRTTPSLLVKLRGAVAIDLRAATTVAGNRLITEFPNVPDAPVSKFSLKVNGGKNGILVVTRTAKAKIDVCDRKQIADVETVGHNSRRADFVTRVKTPCGGKQKASRKAGKK
jgi:hypothetical protein